MTSPTPEPSSVLRFDLAIQRDHLLVYTIALVTAVAGWALGVFPMRMDVAVGLWVVACASSILLHFLFRRGFNRRVLNAIWIGDDVLFVTLGVYATGGISSPCFVWYAATASAAAFVGGRKAAWIASIANTVAYLILVMLMGQAALFDQAWLLAFMRMLFVFGASFFFISGVANLTEKRLRIRSLEAEQRRKVEELTAMTQELADANRRSQEADRLKSQFLANMSHELRTPMNSIIGFSEILSERLEGRIDPKHLGFLEHIHTSGTHLLSIINDVLDLSRIEAGKMDVYREFVPLAPVVDSVCQMSRGLTHARSTFVLEIPADLPQVETDVAKLKQVLFNLVSNAVKFSPREKPVTIRASVEAEVLTLSVRDEGIGIDPAHHALIFEEFRQVDGSARREFGGTGLGLALVQKLVELQGGQVGVTSSVGEGSTFTVTLPVRTRSMHTEAGKASSPERARAVLVVEDDSGAYAQIASALKAAGYLPVRARHGDEAIRLAKESLPVAVTLDLVLPGMDGWEVLKRLKSDAATRKLPVIIVSMVENRDLGLALGADDYFVKPVDGAHLAERIREISSRSGGGVRRLLIIDDDPAVHARLTEELAILGFGIDQALSGEEGLRSAAERIPDVIILDLMMPGMSGFEVARAFQQDPRTAGIPILILTSKDLSSEERASLQSSVAGMLRKGASPRDLLIQEIRRMTEG